ncbi:MAG: tetratricopeptide repeat protein [Nitrososphaeraceae archaeon]
MQIDQNDAGTRTNKDLALDNLGKLEEAIRCYDKALEIDPTHAIAQNNKIYFLNLLNKQKKKRAGSKDNNRFRRIIN